MDRDQEISSVASFQSENRMAEHFQKVFRRALRPGRPPVHSRRSLAAIGA